MKKLIYVLLTMSMVLFRAVAEPVTANPDCDTNIPNFIKLSYRQASEAISKEESAILALKSKKICDTYITNLVNEIQLSDLANDKRVLAIVLLGDLQPHDSKSIAVLIKYIDLKATRFDPATRIQRWGEYPAQEALMKIGGQPVISALLDELPIENNQVRRKLMCGVLKRPKLKEGARDQIKERIAAESNLSKRKNLELALEELDK